LAVGSNPTLSIKASLMARKKLREEHGCKEWRDTSCETWRHVLEAWLSRPYCNEPDWCEENYRICIQRMLEVTIRWKYES
jgi:hypothetical protein